MYYHVIFHVMCTIVYHRMMNIDPYVVAKCTLVPRFPSLYPMLGYDATMHDVNTPSKTWPLGMPIRRPKHGHWACQELFTRQVLCHRQWDPLILLGPSHRASKLSADRTGPHSFLLCATGATCCTTGKNLDGHYCWTSPFFDHDRVWPTHAF